MRWRSESGRGSSPLSRGIHLASTSGHTPGGIIPALAGNTKDPMNSPSIPKDHPRSRGEYSVVPIPANREAGSSPLSRGIRAYEQYGVIPPGIIPALAGNTSTHTAPAVSSTDHPRSRGEYSSLAEPNNPARGSSPLSRGIPTFACTAPNVLGIIPALAGNTIQASRTFFHARDHPRSRGEYQRGPCGPCSPRGSSPLSRGILSCPWWFPRGRGIIPALAGNT